MRETIFFLLVFLLFFLAVKGLDFWIAKYGGSMKKDYNIMLIGVIYTLVVVSVFFLAKIRSCSENFWDVTDSAKCKGGEYFWQGDDETSEMCKKMAQTEQGRLGIASYNCPKGFIGTPSNEFVYSHISDDNFENEMCKKKATCTGPPLDAQCMDSFVKWTE